MAVDEAGCHDGALEVDHRGRRSGEGAGPPVVVECGDPAAGDGKGGLREQFAGADVEEAGGEQYEAGVHGRTP